MKKIIFLIIALLIYASSANAANITVSKIIPTISGTAVSGSSLVTGSSPYYTDAIDVRNNRGFSSIIILSSASIDVAFEVSEDGTTFYDPKDTSGTSLGSIASAISTNQWRVFTARMANYIRFKITINSNSTVSLTYLQSAEY